MDEDSFVGASIACLPAFHRESMAAADSFIVTGMHKEIRLTHMLVDGLAGGVEMG